MNLEAESVTLVSRFSTLFPRGLGAAAITVCGSGCCCDPSVQGDTPPFARTITSADTPQRKAGRPARPHRKADDADARLDWVGTGDLFAVALKH
ncbi:unnamed protein product [Sphagnum tenellum]